MIRRMIVPNDSDIPEVGDIQVTLDGNEVELVIVNGNIEEMEFRMSLNEFNKVAAWVKTQTERL